MTQKTTVTQTTRSELVAANLRYGRSTAGLRVRAYAQVVVKALMTAERGAWTKPERIRTRCSELIQDATPTREAVASALDFLRQPEQGLVEQQRGRYRLVPAQWDALHAQVSSRRSLVERVTNRHFHVDAEPQRIRNWFDDAGARFFAAYGDRWVAAVARDESIQVAPVHVQELARDTALEHGFSDEEANLLAYEFSGFLRSRMPEDNQILWHFGRAMFAARLMAADLARDPLSAGELANSQVLLDTNVLLGLALGRAEGMPALDGLAKAFKDLGIRPVYIYRTLQEYRGVVGAWRSTTLAELDRHGFQVVHEAQDEHVQAAVDKGCVRRDEFEQYYEGLYTPPPLIGDVELKLLDDRETAATTARGMADSGLVNEVQNIWSENRRLGKSRLRAEHDAALTAVGRACREGGDSCWIVTTDRTMQKLATRWSRNVASPLWITFDTLIQILAVEEEGSGLDATVFAPMLSRMIAEEVETCDWCYTLEDIQILDEIIQGSEELPPQEVQAIGRKIRQRVLGGADREDPELNLEISRLAAKARHSLGADAAKARAAAASARNDAAEAVRVAERETATRRDAERKLREERIANRLPERTKSLRREARRDFLRSLPVVLAIILAAAAVVIAIFDAASAGETSAARIGLVADVGVLLVLGFGPLRKAWKEYREKSASSESRAIQQLEQEAKDL